jgi:hypothetical protein
MYTTGHPTNRFPDHSEIRARLGEANLPSVACFLINVGTRGGRPVKCSV